MHLKSVVKFACAKITIWCAIHCVQFKSKVFAIFFSSHFIDETMAMRQMIVVVLNALLMVLVAGQTELLDKDVEIISGKNIEQLSDAVDSPLDAKYAGQFANIYAQPVSFAQRCCLFGDFCWLARSFLVY